ncbi:uncharacterized protein N7503_001204 [Penicillium pulvis]|uniref:uncharacterized protein n=1 Tax=Penicillium pulvis TaxID=1562058 RepID=UPI002546930D|nr:uncharacterized protein N7503_001204 [Penicillium pulvis]KAJ5814454.1 hypothetical protein N7503_001204 [Penicillium pulvis]
MPSASTNKSLPLPRPDQVYVTISALDGGHLTLPEQLFVTDADPNRRVTVPSLSFLIRHPSRGSEPSTRLLFDLGMKRNPEEFPPLMQTHIRNRQPTILYPDVGDSLRAGGLDPAEIEMVILSHVHWDHVGTPVDFSKAQFLVGAGTLHLLRHGAGPHYPAEIFIPDLLPEERTQEFPPANTPAADPELGEVIPDCVHAAQQSSHTWQPLGPFASAIDLFADGSAATVVMILAS